MECLCPQCGAAVRFESTAAVMVVCGSCRSTLTRDGEAARRVGHMAALVDDGSPIRIGTTGLQGKRSFRVLGRLRLQYEAGAWNEWYIVFADGTHGWLSDASAQYAVTWRDDAANVAMLPPYADLRAGGPVKVDGALYTVSDLRRCRCLGGEGELPVEAGDGWEASVADARRGDSFVTLDYSGDSPVVYVGTAGRLQLDPATLRSREEIEAGAGRHRGELLPLDCPNCAGTVSIAVAMATQVVCPSCGSLLDCSGERAEIIEANRRLAEFKTTLALGARGRFGAEYTVIGIMRCEVPDDASEPDWTEYLLFNPERGYLWLVETQDGWQRVTVCDEWPLVTHDTSARWDKRTWTRRYAYAARVKQVFGAFNWRVRRGDTTHVTDFASNTDMLTREESGDEVSWSHAVRIADASVAQAFGLPRPAARVTAEERNEDDEGLGTIAVLATMALLVVNESITLLALVIGVVLIWLPLLVTGQLWGATRALLEDE